MKRLFYICSLAVLAGCSENLPMVEKAESEAIAFGVESVAGIDNTITRGYLVETPRRFHSTMAVYAYQYGGSFDVNAADKLMDHMVVRNAMPTPGDERWYYAPIIRWPRPDDAGSKNKVRFHAYAPAIDATNSSVLSVSDATGMPVLTYTVPTVVQDQHDVMIADPVDRTILADDNSYTAEVDYKFYHMLSAIRFRMIPTLNINCTVKSITIRADDLKYKADFNVADHTMVSGSGESGAVNYHVSLANVHYPNNGFKWDKDNKPTGDGTIINPLETTFFVIPQAINTTSSKVKVDIEVVIEGIAGTQTLTCDLESQNWEMGKCYTYMVNIKFPSLILTLHSTSIDEWEDVAESSFTEDDEISMGWVTYPCYLIGSDWGNVAVAVGEEEYDITDANTGVVTHVNTHAPTRSAVFNLQTSSTSPLKLRISNPLGKFLKFVHDPSNSHWDENKYDYIDIPAGQELTTFSVVPNTETFSASGDRVAYVTLVKEGSSPRLLSFITDSNLPYNDDHTQMGFQLLTPAEWDSRANIIIKTKN